jgi:hypothetical protein
MDGFKLSWLPICESGHDTEAPMHGMMANKVANLHQPSGYIS